MYFYSFSLDTFPKTFKLVGILISFYICGVLGHRPDNKTTPNTTANPFSKLLSKFHQNDFKLVYERTVLARTDPKLGKVCVLTFKFNRTTPVFDGSGILSIEPRFQVKVIVQAYSFASNEYREFPMRFQFNFCQGISSSTFGMDRLIKSGNFVCPILKDTWYNVTNFTPHAEKFPPYIADGHYMLELQFWYQSKELWALYNYGIIERPIPIPAA